MKKPKRSDFPNGRDGAKQYSKAMKEYIASAISETKKSASNTKMYGLATTGISKGSTLTEQQAANRKSVASHSEMGTKPKTDVNTKMYGSATDGMTKNSKLSPQQRANRQSAASKREMNPRSVKDIVKKVQPKSSPKSKQTSKESSKPAAKPEKFESKGYNPQLEKMRGGEMPKTKEQIAKAAARQAAFRKQKKSGAYTGSYSKFNPKNFTMAGSFPPMA